MPAIALPTDRVERALALATVAVSLAIGIFYAVSALYFTRVVGLPATTVGFGLAIAGGVGVVASYLGGRLSDRFGADHMQAWGGAAMGVGMLAYLTADGTVTFVLIASVVLGGRGMWSTARSTTIARWFAGPERVAVRARLRVVNNVFIGLGTLAAAIALAVDTATAYRVAMAASGLLVLLAVGPVVRMIRYVAMMRPGALRAPVESVGRPSGRSPLRDPTYLAVVALSAVVAMHFGLQNFGIPLWIAGHTDAPTVMISAMLILNTIIVALFQVRASRGTDDIAVAGRAMRWGTLLLGAGCLLLGSAGGTGVVLAVVLLVSAAVATSVAELLAEAGSWGLAYELADPANAGAYQGVSQTGYSVAGMVGPAVISATAIQHGFWGWVALATIFVLAGVGVAWLADRAARRMRDGQRSAYVASETPV